MESVHCFRCYRFPSKSLDFYITNCMHIFCFHCRNDCEQREGKEDREGQKEERSATCHQCHLKPCRLLKMGPNMPNQVRSMFTPIREDFEHFGKEMSRVMTFQSRQRHNLISGMSKKVKVFDKLKEAYQEEKTKKEHYKKQLEHAYRIIQSKDQEIIDLKKKVRETPPTSSPAPSEPSVIRVFSDSMYKTPEKKKKSMELAQIPPFMKYKSKTVQAETKTQQLPPVEAFKTPNQPIKATIGFTTPANPPHMFPHLKKLG
uniref:RING-type domain-containing protein n=1 Tax=Caenorhabditis tropicalis TaxID=1561998 RepID=A0A1I7UN31_9PELO